MVARALILAVLQAVSSGLFARRARLLARMVRLGRPVDRGGDLPKRLTREGVQVLGQRKLFQRLAPGLMHAFIFWGFLVLLATIVEALGQAVKLSFAIPVIGRSAGLGLVEDVFAALVVVGLAIAVGIRIGQKPERFVGSHKLEAYRILGLIFWIIATLFGLITWVVAIPVALVLQGPLGSLLTGVLAAPVARTLAFVFVLLLVESGFGVLGSLAIAPLVRRLHADRVMRIADRVLGIVPSIVRTLVIAAVALAAALVLPVGNDVRTAIDA
jgi:Colicin V production protein.